MNASSSVAALAARHQFRRRAAGDHLARVHRGEPIEPLRLFHVGGRNDDAHAWSPRADAVDQLPELAARQRVDAGGRLVEDQQVRIVDQRAAQRQLLLHAARQLAGRPVGKGIETGRGEQLFDALFALGFGLAEQAAEEVEVLEHGQGRVQVAPEALRHVGDAGQARAAMLRVAHVAIQCEDLAFLDPAHAGNQREQRGLADAVRPDEPDHAAGRYCRGSHRRARPSGHSGATDVAPRAATAVITAALRPACRARQRRARSAHTRCRVSPS